MIDDLMIGHRAVMASVKLGSWMSAALDDPNTCEAMKADIREWFSAGDECSRLTDRIKALSAENERLRALVEELADDLEVEVRDRWGYDERLAHKLKRDMDVINRARAALGDTQ
jgi:hypothetical protein